MINQTFRQFALLLALGCQTAIADSSGLIYPIPEGLARLIIERADEPLLYRQDAMISLNGRQMGALARGSSLQMDLAPGIWRVSASARVGAEHTLLAVKLKENSELRVLVELDPTRFSRGGGIAGLSNLLRQSMNAPNDDRLPLFRLRQIVTEIPEGER